MAGGPMKITSDDMEAIIILGGHYSGYAALNKSNQYAKASLVAQYQAVSYSEAVDCICVMIMSNFIEKPLSVFYRDYLAKLGSE